MVELELNLIEIAMMNMTETDSDITRDDRDDRDDRDITRDEIVITRDDRDEIVITKGYESYN